jgi:RNA polymerase sigma-70 factor (ECF subfamily)
MLLEGQDRSLWNNAQIAEGTEFLYAALRRGAPGVYQLQAAIAAVHCEARSSDATDWRQIVLLYDALEQAQPSPAVSLNRAVAIAMAGYLERAFSIVDSLAQDQRMERYLFLHSTKADLFRRLGRSAEAVSAYRQALELADSAPERRFLERRLGEMSIGD